MDHFLLTPPGGGTVYNLGSWLDMNDGPGVDFDAGALFQRDAFSRPAVLGGEYGLTSPDRHAARRMRFQQMLPSGISGHLIRAAQEGAVLDLKLSGVATAEAVRFDVLGGRWLGDHHVRVYESGRSRGTLELDVQPFGYWPTEILLASAASVGLPGFLAVPAGSVLGDVPGLAHLVISPSCPTTFGTGSVLPEMAAWSLGARPSFQALWLGASFLPSGAVNASISGDHYALGSQALFSWPTSVHASDTFSELARVVIPSALAPAYIGWYRAFVWARISPSQIDWQLSLDAVPHSNVAVKMASAAPIATLLAGKMSFLNSAGSPNYQLQDLGVLSLPPTASGLSYDTAIRLWHKAGSTNTGVGSPLLKVGGLYLLPLDGDAGVLSKGLVFPDPNVAAASARNAGKLDLDGITSRAHIRGLADDVIAQDAYTFYHGELPRVSPTTVSLDVVAAAISASQTYRSAPAFAAVSLSYRPRFIFSKTI